MDRLPIPQPDLRNAARCRRWVWLRGGLGWLLIVCSVSGCSWFRNLVCNSPEKSHRLVEQARHAEEVGHIAEALALYEKALEENPNDSHVHRDMARLCQCQGQSQLAMEHLENAIEQNPEDVEANVELAQLYIEHNQAALAVERLEAALQNDPRHTTALILRAKLAEVLGDSQIAIETYHRVLGCDPNNVEARMRIAALQLNRNQPALSAPLLRSVCHCSRATPEEIAEARWNLGIAYGQEQRWQDAVRSLTSATEQRANCSAEDWYRLAYAHSQLEDWQAVRESIDRALQINPRHENSQAMLGVLRWQQESPDTPILRIGHSVKPIPIPDLW